MRNYSDCKILERLWGRIQRGDVTEAPYIHRMSKDCWTICWGLSPALHVHLPDKTARTFKDVGELAEYLDIEYGIARVTGS